LYIPIQSCFDPNTEPRPYLVPKRLLGKEIKKLNVTNRVEAVNVVMDQNILDR
jgi:hypothetical protein